MDDCPERVPAHQSQKHAGEPCSHPARHRGACETEPAPGEKHGFMWYPQSSALLAGRTERIPDDLTVLEHVRLREERDPIVGKLVPRAYTGPFDPPPPASLVGAIGWRHVKVPDGPNRWRPNGWMIVFPDSIRTLDANGDAVIDSTLWAP